MSNTIKIFRSTSSSLGSLSAGELAWRDSDLNLWIGNTTPTNINVTASSAIYGDGSDGSITFDGSSTVLGMAPTSSTYTLTRDIYPSSMTVNSGVTVISSGKRIFCTGTLTINGAVRNDGPVGKSNGLATAGASGGFYGGGSTGGASSTTTGSAGSSSTRGALGGSGGHGGAGASSGGAGGSGTAPTALAGGIPRNLQLLFFSAPFNSSSVSNGGAGGGGGGGDGTNKGAAGGGGGGIVGIAAPIITGSGAISANGGDGGTPTTGNCGGGGGGGGGYVIVVSRTCSITPTAAGGSPGSPSGSATNANVSGGSAGTVVQITTR